MKRAVVVILCAVALTGCKQDPSELDKAGKAAYDRKDYTAAFKNYRKAGEQGDAKAQTCLGFMCTKGQSVLQDYAEAAKWYRKAAEQGNALAQFNLGLF